jgi:predicted DNA-binding transcriptional regulator AlpA
MTRSLKCQDVLPASLAPRGLSRIQAAHYIGLSPSKLDQLVRDGRMPRPIRIDGRIIWDRIKLDAAFEALPDGNERDDDPWSNAAP